MLFFTGCQGTRITIGNDRDQDSHVSYEKAGPPPWAPAHGYRAKHRYYYYPPSHVYHEKDRGVWFFYKDGGWRISVSLPSEIRINMNDYVILEMDDDRPYHYHKEVIKRYPPGQLKKKNSKHNWKD
jgi:hypothetical protein